MREEQNSKFG